MASIVRKAVIEAPAARCWDVLRDFSALPERLARGFVTGLTMTGERERTITFFSGVGLRRRVGPARRPRRVRAGRRGRAERRAG
jgi:hypothetical protein